MDLRDGHQPTSGQIALSHHLDASVAAVDLELSELDERRARLTVVRADLVRVIESLASPASGGDAVPAPGASTPVSMPGEGTAPGAPKPAQSAGRAFVCEVCDEEFPRPQALGAHRRYKHPKTPVVPVAASIVNPVQPAAPMSRSEFATALTTGSKERVLPDGKVLACTEKGCGHEAGSIRDLIHHTISTHDRQPYSEEKWPVQRQAVNA